MHDNTVAWHVDLACCSLALLQGNNAVTVPQLLKGDAIPDVTEPAEVRFINAKHGLPTQHFMANELCPVLVTAEYGRCWYSIAQPTAPAVHVAVIKTQSCHCRRQPVSTSQMPACSSQSARPQGSAKPHPKQRMEQTQRTWSGFMQR
jgi:hypothetical protein